MSGARIMATKNDFEKNLGKLEKIVERLESGELSLSSSLKDFEEGIEYYNKCKKELDEIEKKVASLTKKINE